MLTEALRVALSAQGGGGRTGVDESVGPTNAPRIDFAKVNRDYASLGGRSFDGTESVIQVQEWIDICDRIFDDLELEDAQKRKLTSRQLTGRAMNWWNAITAATFENEMIWNQFKQHFEEKFIPKAQKAILFKKFADLEQGQVCD